MLRREDCGRLGLYIAAVHGLSNVLSALPDLMGSAVMMDVYYPQPPQPVTHRLSDRQPCFPASSWPMAGAQASDIIRPI